MGSTVRSECGALQQAAQILVLAVDRRRCGLTLRYCPPEVRITDPGWANGVEAILCRGAAGAWKTYPRPANNDITKTTSPHVVGNN